MDMQIRTGVANSEYMMITNSRQSKPGAINGIPIANSPRSRGFTLLESLVAFVLTLIAVLALVSLFPAGLVSIQQSGDSTQAQAIAQHWLDYIREYYQTETRLPSGFPASGSTFDCTPTNEQQMIFRGTNQQQMTFTCDYQYVNVAGAGGTPEHRIDFFITWSTPQRGTESRTYEEYVIN